MMNMSKKKILIFTILIFLFIFYSFEFKINIKLGDNYSIIVDKKSNIAYKIDLIDLQIILFTIFDYKTFNKDLDLLLSKLYEDQKSLIDSIRNEFLIYLSNVYKGIKQGSNIYAFYYNMTLGYDLDELQYHWMEFKRRKIDLNRVLLIKYNVCTNYIARAYLYAIEKIYGELIGGYSYLNNFILENNEKFNYIINTNPYIKIIHDFFKDFIKSFNFQKIIDDYYNFYSLYSNEKINTFLDVYLSWFSRFAFFYENDIKFYYEGFINQRIIMINGIAQPEKVLRILLHEIGHYFTINSNLLTVPKEKYKWNVLYFTVLRNENEKTKEEDKILIKKQLNNLDDYYRNFLLL